MPEDRSDGEEKLNRSDEIPSGRLRTSASVPDSVTLTAVTRAMHAAGRVVAQRPSAGHMHMVHAMLNGCGYEKYAGNFATARDVSRVLLLSPTSRLRSHLTPHDPTCPKPPEPQALGLRTGH